jgi:hypothetical protein
LTREKKAPVSMATARAIESCRKDTTRGLDTDSLEKPRVPEREFDLVTDLGKLLANAAVCNVVVADFAQGLVLFLTLDRAAFAVDTWATCKHGKKMD